MKVVVSGSTGLIGSALVRFLATKGHSVIPLVRKMADSGGSSVYWDPAAERLDMAALEGCDAIVHLAGKNVAAERWNDRVKAEIRDSRVKAARLLSDAVSKLSSPPKLMVVAEGIGYYGDRRDEVLGEDSERGTGFLADICRDCDDVTGPLVNKGVRVVNLRIGIVLSAAGGALAAMLPAFKMGAGGLIGSGRQYWSWIALDDVVEIIDYVLDNERIGGPVNTVAPNPVTNYEFTKLLGKVTGRPTVLPMPAFAARLVFGEMADALLLSSARVRPEKLLAQGYVFKFPDLEPALRHELE